jgi:hypothetical protein
LALLAPLLYADVRPGLTVHETDLRGKPSSSAASIATLPSGSELTVFERKGGWYRVEAEAGPGWLRLASIRFPSTARTEADDGTDEVLSMMRIGPGSGAMSSSTTTGVRGLDGASIQSASPSEEQLERLEGLAGTSESGRALAEKGELEAVDIGYLEMAELDETLLEQTRSARTEEELRGPERPKDDCYGDGCDPDIPFLGGD